MRDLWNRNKPKWIAAIFVLLCLSLSVFADNDTRYKADSEQDIINNIYRKIDFCNFGTLNPKVFALAYKGYQSLLESGKLDSEKQILSICDFSLSANVYRLWIIDLVQNKVLQNTFVAHGQGTGEEYASSFSNTEGSHQSSMGFYTTGSTYDGAHGLSLYLHGMDEGYNSSAFERYIVMHGAAYVSENFIQENQRLGRSWGCPAIPKELAPDIIDRIKEGTCLFVYYPDKKYLASSVWLQKKSSFVKNSNNRNDFQLINPNPSESKTANNTSN